MSEPAAKKFDCVGGMREIRDRLSAEIAGMSHEDLVFWLRTRRCSDPVLQRLAEKARQQADAPDRPSAGG